MISPAQGAQSRVLRSIVNVAEPAAQLVFFPYAGGNFWAAGGLSEGLPANWSLTAVQYPGRGPRIAEPNAGSVEELARSVLAELAAGPPLLLFGHSFGAYVALETASLLASARCQARLLAVSAAAPPGEALNTEHTLDDEELSALLVSRGGTPADLLENEDLMRLSLPGIRWDFRLADSYRPALGPLATPIIAIGGRADAAVRPAALARWEHHTQRWLGCRLSTGGHFYYLTDPDAVIGALTAHTSMIWETQP